MPTSRKVPIATRNRPFRVGGSIVFPLPLDWFRAHGYGDTPEEIVRKLKGVDLLVLANRDVRIINPNHRKKVEAELHGVVSEEVADADVGIKKR